MRTFKTRLFGRFAHKERITDAMLCEAARRLRSGQIDADLGGGVAKQRIARAGGGKSGGYRSIILFRQRGHVFFAYGFAKSDQANIGPDELRSFKALAREMLALDETKLTIALRDHVIEEVICDDEAVQE
jgi:hypothetical protein